MEVGILQAVVAALFMIAIALMSLMLYISIYRMARVYNWNGTRYCYLGNTALHKEGKDFTVRIGERMVDLSHTTLYRICPSRIFCKKYRYRDMFVYADNDRRHLVVDMEPMKTEIPF